MKRYKHNGQLVKLSDVDAARLGLKASDVVGADESKPQDKAVKSTETKGTKGKK